MFAYASKYFSKTLWVPGLPKNISKVEQASKCLQKLLHIFQRLLKCLEVLNDFYEVVEASEWLPKLLNIFQRLLECLEVLNIFPEFVEASKCLPKVPNIFQTSWVPGDPKNISEVV